ncbi:alkaline phosphatase D family protein [Christiangramia aquimixticola]|uniref:alkaline phosphatase D family protein n=1 Tax=Christiangramia aquimixticola TaxID=1697558 RepID=UPI003AA7EC4D
MRPVKLLLIIAFLLSSCGGTSIKKTPNPDFTLAFGSCSQENKQQPLWKAVLKNEPDVFVWGGDNIYADTDKPIVMQAAYEEQKNKPGYQKLLNAVPVLGTWDDHDYGLNDGGKEWHFKEISQQLFLDFFDVPVNSPRRNRKGVYHSEVFETEKGSIKIILLDTRYFRDPLVLSANPDKRYDPSKGTILGEQQWEWLEDELRNSEADFNVILSSIQILSVEHGFETWGNFPSEIDKLTDLILSSEAKNIILLSGDRHISEFSAVKIQGLKYPLTEFTSSGLTHAYEDFDGEPNSNRVGEVVSEKSFGVLKFNFKKQTVEMEMRGEQNKLQQQHKLEFN